MIGRKTPTIKELVNDKKWKILRYSLIGQWKKAPQYCCIQLKNYLGKLNKTSTKKLRIVKEYLSKNSFRTGGLRHSCINKLRVQISNELYAREVQGYW